MDYLEAREWLKGNRSTWNSFAGQDNDIVNTARADAAMTEQAYWVVRAHSLKTVKSSFEGEAYDKG